MPSSDRKGMSPKGDKVVSWKEPRYLKMVEGRETNFYFAFFFCRMDLNPLNGQLCTHRQEIQPLTLFSNV